jgi:hypothetical protein
VIDPAVQMVAKSQAAAALMSARLGGVSVKQHHVIISPPEDWFLQANDPLDRTFEVIKEILDALGAEGSVQYHGWSGNDKQEDDRGKWKERLFNDRTWQDVRAELMPRPHFHAILNCPFIPGQSVTERIYAATGWVIHRVADSDGKSLPTTERVAKASTYTLSHTSIDTRGDGSNKAQYRKFGSTWHDAEVKEYRRRRAEHDVRKVAPKVLGISAKKIRCEASVEEASGDDLIDEYNASDAATDDTTGEGVDDAPADDTATDETADDTHDDTAEGSELEKCKGALIPISEADNYLNDDDWVDRCPYSEQLRRAYQDFQDQAQLDNPPPMIAAFS